MDVNNFFVKKGYILNPVKTFDQGDLDKYWTTARLETSKYLQYHVYEYAYNVYKNGTYKKIIDIGSGPGLKMKHFFSKCDSEIYLMDQPSTANIIDKTYPEAVFIESNLEEPIQLQEKFDLIICVDVIEHLENPDILLCFIRNNLNKGGVLIISTPDRDMRRGPTNNQSPNKEHVREWSYDEFAKYIDYSGFKILKHRNLPSIKLSKFYFFAYKIFYKKLRQSTWYPCQTIVAKLK